MRAGDVARLSFIRRARELGFSIDDIRGFLGLNDHPPTCAEVHETATRHRADIRDKVAGLERLDRRLSAIMAACTRSVTPDCALIDALLEPRPRRTSDTSEQNQRWTCSRLVLTAAPSAGRDTGRVAALRLEARRPSAPRGAGRAAGGGAQAAGVAWASIISATRPVQPVWCAAPTPAPSSPWKHS
jgi:DNA-binding transcriptional MerR regulator